MNFDADLWHSFTSQLSDGFLMESSEMLHGLFAWHFIGEASLATLSDRRLFFSDIIAVAMLAFYF